ncbi:MAG: hypothetical protein ACOX1U_04405 [Saccharofermentanales bacterium]
MIADALARADRPHRHQVGQPICEKYGRQPGNHPQAERTAVWSATSKRRGIYTFDGKGELLITIMSSLAQEESRSISENITWGQRKSFSDGKVHLPYKRFLGYEKGEDGRPAVMSRARQGS